jgi:thiol-disulfide isomerase/thioredoxin
MKKSMKNLVLVALCCISSSLFAQQGYNIKLNVKPYKNAFVFLGYHYGKNKGLTDSAFVNNLGQAVFSGKTALPGGIYFVTSPRKEILFEVLIDKQQNFSISADTTDLVNKVVFTNSSDNLLFQQYTKYINSQVRQLQPLQNQMMHAKSPADSIKARNQITGINLAIQQYRENLMKTNPKHMLTSFFNLMKEPTVPPASKMPGGKYDSAYAFQYYKSHYWDGVMFNDGRLVRTPIFEGKLDQYFKYVISPEPDSINKETDWMLGWSRSNKEMFKYLLSRFIDKYINPEIMGQDEVFVHLFEKYFGDSKAVDWLSEKQMKYINDRYYSIVGNRIGEKAAPLDMIDSTGKKVSLYDVKAPFTVVIFWEPGCSHCKETLPKIDSIYRAKWKAKNVALYAVRTESTIAEWKAFISKSNLTDWYHVYQTEEDKTDEIKNARPSYRQMYDIIQTPTLYLLDEQKRIIAKKLTYLQVDDVMDRRKK